MSNDSISKKNEIRLIINAICTLFYVALYIAMVLFYYDKNIEFDFGIRGYIVLGTLYLLIVFACLNAFESYKLGNKRISELVLSSGFALLVSNILSYFIFGLIEGHLVKVLPYLILLFLQIVVSILYSYFGNKIVRFRFPAKKTIVFYSKGQEYVIDKIKKYQHYEFDIVKTDIEKSIKTFLENDVRIYESIITIGISEKNKEKLIKECYKHNVQIYDVPDIADVIIKSSVVTNFIDTPLFKFNKFGPNLFEMIIKRFIDIFGSLVLLILTSPIMIFSAIIIKVQDGGDVFFRQKRLTQNGKEFELIKFRSMIMNAEPDGKMIRAKENDNRITKFGSFIRKTRIDELPQIINILKGDLSLVGPRALRVEEYTVNEKNFPEFKYRLKVKAGLTGYAQVYGKYNTTFKDKLLLDIFYIENYSLVLDIKLLLMTCIVIFNKDSTEGF